MVPLAKKVPDPCCRVSWYHTSRHFGGHVLLFHKYKIFFDDAKNAVFQKLRCYTILTAIV